MNEFKLLKSILKISKNFINLKKLKYNMNFCVFVTILVIVIESCQMAPHNYPNSARKNHRRHSVKFEKTWQKKWEKTDLKYQILNNSYLPKSLNIE